MGFGASRNCTHLLPYPHSPRCRSFHDTFGRFARHQYDPHDSERHRVCSDRDCANSYCGHKKTSHTYRYHRRSSGHNKAFWLISRFSHTDHNEAWIPFCLSFLPSRPFSLGELGALPLSPRVWLADFLLLGKASRVGFLMSHVFSMGRSTEREVFSSLLFYHIPSSLS